VALADESELTELFQHRFDSGALTGHTAGNLIIAALTEMTGDFARAVESAGAILKAEGSVYPATTSLVRLGASVEGGEISGQVAVAQTATPIQAVYLEPPNPPAYPAAVQAIRQADQVVLGPGSLFTSLIATLLVPGIRSALKETKGRRVFVCNNRIQKGETEGFSVSDHVGALLAHAGPDCVDVLLVQSPVLEHDGVHIDRGGIEFLDLEVVEADVSTPTGLHDPAKLARVLARLA
jgi:uncharacterized cofD-like protein